MGTWSLRASGTLNRGGAFYEVLQRLRDFAAFVTKSPGCASTAGKGLGFRG